MKSYKLILLPLLLIGFSACKNVEEANNDTKAVVAEPQYPKGELVDSFSPYMASAQYTILNATISGNILTIGVQYSGGCETHEFKLVGSKMIMKSLPPKRGIRLFHDSKGDSCRELVNQELKFDISDFAYEGGEIILLLEGWEPELSYTKAGN